MTFFISGRLASCPGPRLKVGSTLRFLSTEVHSTGKEDFLSVKIFLFYKNSCIRKKRFFRNTLKPPLYDALMLLWNDHCRQVGFEIQLFCFVYFVCLDLCKRQYDMFSDYTTLKSCSINLANSRLWNLVKSTRQIQKYIE